MDRLRCDLRLLLHSSLSHTGVLHRGIWSWNLPPEQFYRLFVAPGGSIGPRTRVALDQPRSEGIPTVYATTSRIQILAGMYTGNRDLSDNDILLYLRRPSLLANLIDVLLCSFLHDHEATNYAHVQAQICPHQLWKGKIQRCWSGEFNVWWRNV